MEQCLDEDLDEFIKKYQTLWDVVAKLCIDNDIDKWKGQYNNWLKFTMKLKKNGFKISNSKNNPVDWLWDVY